MACFLVRRASRLRANPASHLRLILLATICILLAYSVSSLPGVRYAGQDSPSDSVKRNETLPGDPQPRLTEDEEIQTTFDNQECKHLPGEDDVLVIVRTGATEALEKLPIHFTTILGCIPHFVVYSDFEETIAGHQVYDAFDEVNATIKEQNPDFELYNRLKQNGRDALLASDLATSSHGNTGNLGNPGWRLDKWKFLPLVDKALRIRPSAKWYVFVEADTYLVWENLLTWLSTFDASEPHYIGSQMQIGEVIFGHGGSGFAISSPAMQMVAERRAAHLEEYDEFTAGHWAGDCVLGKALNDVGVHVKWMWPILQAKSPGGMNHATVTWGKRLWCYPVVSYHTVSPVEIATFWEFERVWFEQRRGILRHSDVFKFFVLPQLVDEREGWDNLSSDDRYSDENLSGEESSLVGQAEQDAANSFEGCRRLCHSRTNCVQFSYSSRTCMTSKTITLGRARPGGSGSIRSGWILNKVEAFVATMDECHGETWDL